MDGWEEKMKAATDHPHAAIRIRPSGDEHHVTLKIKKKETTPYEHQAREKDSW